MRFKELFNCEGRVSRGWYFVWGITLFIVKYGLDWLVASKFFNFHWTVWQYLHIVPSNSFVFSPARSTYFVTLLAMSLPFAWIGVRLTVQRLRDAGLPLWLTLLFFIPLLNLFWFLILSILGSAPAVPAPQQQDAERSPLWDSPVISAVAAAVITALLILGAVALSTTALRSYGVALFVAAPFCQGLAAVLIFAYPRRRSWVSCQTVVILSGVLSGLGLLAFAMEGMICILMAAPLLGALAVLGGTVGHAIQEKRWNAKSGPLILLMLVCFLPALMGMEQAGHAVPPLYAVRSSIDIQSDARTVWQNVVTFADLPAPHEWIFKTGLAYPTHATIEGHGAGALRRCVFTTGEFLEPIKIWDEPKLLRFSVASNPAPMHERNPFKEIHPPHLDGFFVSRQGQFLLTPSANGGTHLEGTTWYEHGLWPASYWRLWSDFIIHKIHLRVLNHIKNLSEGGGK